jgi:beta-galactosidase
MLDELLRIGGRRSWELPELPSLNRLPARAWLDRAGTPRHRPLDGTWDFRLVARPDEAPAALAEQDGWTRVQVPGLWTMQGFGRPQYTNVQMPFPERPPHVPEQNETGVYRRTFTVPRGWRSRPVVLGFGGCEGALHVLVNGRPVGIAKDARTPAEFDVSELGRTSCTRSSSAGRTRASSATRTNGGTRGCRARSTSSRRRSATCTSAPT